MAIKIPPRMTPGSMRPPAPHRSPRPHRHRAGGAGSKQQQPGEHTEEVHEPELPLLGRAAALVQGINKRQSGTFSSDDYRELERLAEQLIAAQHAIAAETHPDDPYAQQHLLEITKMQLRMLLQSLQPPPELMELFQSLWSKVRSTQPHDSFARRTLMNTKVRKDVMNRQVEEAVDEADREATHRRVEAIARDGGGEQGEPQEAPTGEAQEEAKGEPTPETPRPSHTLKHTLKLLRKKRRSLQPLDAEDAAQKALDAMRVLRDEIAPRWAPETQPWLLNTADTHVYQTVLAVVPEELLQETNAYQGIQNLRAGEHAFAFRADARIGDGARR